MSEDSAAQWSATMAEYLDSIQDHEDERVSEKERQKGKKKGSKYFPLNYPPFIVLIVLD